MFLKGRDLKALINEALKQDFLSETTINDNGGYTFDVSDNGTIKIVGRPNGVNTPKTLSTSAADKVAKALKAQGKVSRGLDAAINKDVSNQQTVKPSNTSTSKKPDNEKSDKDLEGWSVKFKRLMMIVPDAFCGPDLIPLWIYPFFCFLGLRETPLTLVNPVYLQCLHRICDIANIKGTNIAGPVHIEAAQASDPLWSLNKQGIVGTEDLPFGGDWSHGYDYTSNNPYMHIAMSLTNFSFTGPPGGPYEIKDQYDFNAPGKVDPPLGDPKYMLQKVSGWSNLPVTVKKHLSSGLFSVIEDLMRYYEATLNYGGFSIEATTVKPLGYKRPVFKKKKK
jgi:hypothetical protein